MKDPQYLAKTRALFLLAFYITLIQLTLYLTWVLGDAVWNGHRMTLWTVIAWTTCVYVLVNGIHIVVVLPKKRS